MVTDKQVRRLMKLKVEGKTLEQSADKTGMDIQTARKYLTRGLLPSAVKPDHTWRTRKDPFEGVWDEIYEFLRINHGLKPKTLFQHFQRLYPGRWSDGQKRTFERGVKKWRALEGPGKEVFFPQVHHPGRLCESDFTHMTKLEVTLCGQPFNHMIYHFVLTYSNWEYGSICFSESFESLSEGFQQAIFALGGVPAIHQTDRLSTAVNNTVHPEEFTPRYQALLTYYDIEGQKIEAGKGNQNGDVEQSHYRFKDAVDQQLILRGSRDFSSRKAYAAFLDQLFTERNSGREARMKEELPVLKPLPTRPLEACRREWVRVSRHSTIRVNKNTYSVNSRLIGEKVESRLYVEHLEVWYGQRKVEEMPRLRGAGGHRINYRHVIDSLVRKPGAFENYLYRDDLFPTSHFRIAYDDLSGRLTPKGAVREYLKVLQLAARENEAAVSGVLRDMIAAGVSIDFESVENLLVVATEISAPRDVRIQPIKLSRYDNLLLHGREASC